MVTRLDRRISRHCFFLLNIYNEDKKLQPTGGLFIFEVVNRKRVFEKRRAPRTLSGLPCKDLGLYFDGVSGALITILYNRIAEETTRNRRLKRQIEKVKKRIFNI